MTIEDTGHDIEAPAGKETGPEVIARYLKHLGTGAGVYRMLNAAGEVIYVGKARNLKARVSNYTRLAGHTSRIARMIASTVSMEFMTTATESEALLLEANLIKRFRPYFNVLMRDDKSFPYILISREHAAPQIMKHRGSRNLKGEYFGPFASAGSVNRTLNMLQRAFLLRSCSDAMFESRTRPCLLFQIKRCSAPCAQEISLEDYGKLVDEAERFLQGKTDAVQKKLNTLMEAASAELEYERAARYRDRLAALAHVQAVQGINPRGVEEADVFAIHQQGGQSCIQVFFFRSGQNWGNRAYFPRADSSVELDEVLASFIAQFYDDKPVPRCIFLSHDFAERELLAEALSLKARRKVDIAVPQRGEKAGLVAHALTNAKEALGRKMADASSQARLLDGVAAAFGLAARPERIEVYDNSHIQGTNAVGAMIVAGPEGFVKNQYRKFNIKSQALTPGDDYAMMREVLARRLSRLAKELAASSPLPRGEGGASAPGEGLDGAIASPGDEGEAGELGARAALAEMPFPLTRIGFADPPSPTRGEGYASAGMDVPAPITREEERDIEAIKLNVGASQRTDPPSPLAGEGGMRSIPGEGEPQAEDSEEDAALVEWASEEADAAEPDPGYRPDGLFADADDKKSAWGIPELILIDGGAGQLAAAHEVLDELGIGGITLVGIAKGPDRNAGREHFFMRGRASFMLEPRDPVLYFVQRLRDEAHRFAIGTHRAKRSKAISANPLDEIAGIGPRRRRALLQHFGSAKAISRAGVEDLQAVEGISASMAQTIYDFFQGSTSGG